MQSIIHLNRRNVMNAIDAIDAILINSQNASDALSTNFV